MDAVGVYCHKHPINVKIMKKVSYVFLADGFEEVEALTPVDVLRRGECTVVTVSVTGRREVTGSHGIPVVADALFEDLSFDDAQWLILPGGMPGAKSLYEFEPLQELLKKQAASKDGRIAAICASPGVVLGQLGLLKGETATCYPGFEGMMDGAKVSDRRVVVSGKYVLGAGPALAMKWALMILAETKGVNVSDTVANGMLFYAKNRYDVENYFG